MPLKAYEEFAQEPLRFPIGNKVYEVPPLGFEDGVKLQRMIAGEDDSLEAEPPETLWRMVMGASFDEMVADKVPFIVVQRAGFTAITDFQFGRGAAETVWESGLDPKALTRDTSEPLETPPASDPSSDSVEESATPIPASTTGTTSPRTRKHTPAKKRASSSSS